MKSWKSEKRIANADPIMVSSKELAYLYDIFATLRAKMEIWCCFNPIGAANQLDIFSSLLDDEKYKVC